VPAGALDVNKSCNVDSGAQRYYFLAMFTIL